MQFDRADLIRYFYTVGVVFAGIYLDRTLSGVDLEIVFLIGALVSIPLALYYKFTILQKIEMAHESPDGGAE